MPDFGNAGKRTVRKHTGAVHANVTLGEYLFYSLTVSGGAPIFSFACKHRQIQSEKDFPGHPKSLYEWTWGKNSGDADASDDMYGVAMSFASATKYTLVIEHRRQDDSPIKILKDIDYESTDPNDSFTETLRVFT